MRSWVVTALLVVTTVACGGDEPPPVAERPTSTATIEIVAPEAGAEVSGSSVLVQLDLQGGEIVEVASRDLSPDKGHVHLLLDDRIVSQTFGLSERIDVEPGRHLLQAEFVAADHGPFSPRVLHTITFTVVP